MLSHQFTYNDFTFNGLADIQSGNYASLVSVEGLSSPEIIHREDRLIGQHGIIDYYSFIGKRIITLEGAVIGKDETQMLAKLKELTDAFSIPAVPTAGRSGYANLIMSKSGQVSKMVSAKINSLPRIEKTMHIHRMRRFFVEFRCEDPRIIAVNPKTRTIQRASNTTNLPHVLPMQLGVGTWSDEELVTNGGNFGALPRYRIYGKCTNPQIINLTYPDIQQKFDITLEEGEYIDVDVKAGTAIKNDGQNVLVYESDESKWLNLLPSNNLLRLVTTEATDTGYIEMEWNDTWLSVPA